MLLASNAWRTNGPATDPHRRAPWSTWAARPAPGAHGAAFAVISCLLR
ncbi:hypothetical protein HNR23_004046 [Nocardiopsis mwathae]|uniref:Uncharacterized protein n=1 Tax=Nocardiopsis mwathae TaxID=1472723 RepID=A0A7W9YLY9_9ACTN|nr:hypothetical protein [Nocardiopsis mwathae]